MGEGAGTIVEYSPQGSGVVCGGQEETPARRGYFTRDSGDAGQAGRRGEAGHQLYGWSGGQATSLREGEQQK